MPHLAYRYPFIAAEVLSSESKSIASLFFNTVSINESIEEEIELSTDEVITGEASMCSLKWLVT